MGLTLRPWPGWDVCNRRLCVHRGWALGSELCFSLFTLSSCVEPDNTLVLVDCSQGFPTGGTSIGLRMRMSSMWTQSSVSRYIHPSKAHAIAYISIHSPCPHLPGQSLHASSTCSISHSNPILNPLPSPGTHTEANTGQLVNTH